VHKMSNVKLTNYWQPVHSNISYNELGWLVYIKHKVMYINERNHMKIILQGNTLL